LRNIAVVFKLGEARKGNVTRKKRWEEKENKQKEREQKVRNVQDNVRKQRAVNLMHNDY
jgi:hypothetical protein